MAAVMAVRWWRRGREVAVLVADGKRTFYSYRTKLFTSSFCSCVCFSELPSDHQRRIIGYQDLDAPDYDFFP